MLLEYLNIPKRLVSALDFPPNMCILIYKFYGYASLLIHIMNTEKKHIFKIGNKPHFKMIILCVIGASNLVIVTKNNHYLSFKSLAPSSIYFKSGFEKPAYLYKLSPTHRNL